jgi:hypothetical protein
LCRYILKYWISFFLFLVISGKVFAAPFPELTLYNVCGESSLFPSRKSELVFLGFRFAAKDELSLWYKSLLKDKVTLKHIKCTVLPVLPAWMSLSVTRKPLFKACENKLPKEAMPYVKITFCNGAALAEELGLYSDKGDLEHIHVYYLNEQGNICWHTSGKPTPEILAQFRKVTSVK